MSQHRTGPPNQCWPLMQLSGTTGVVDLQQLHAAQGQQPGGRGAQHDEKSAGATRTTTSDYSSRHQAAEQRRRARINEKYASLLGGAAFAG